MGEHRNSSGGRTIAAGPIIVLVTITVLVLAVLGWFQLRDRISDQGAEAAGQCVEGAAVLTVAADPDISGPVQELATKFNATSPVVRDHCITVEVRSSSSDSVRAGLDSGVAQWDSATLGSPPALWIPQSSFDLAALRDPDIVDGTPRSVGSSPVVLAAPPVMVDALTAVGASWADVVRLQREPSALGLPEWGGLRLALPVGSETGATTLAVAAVAAGISGEPSVPPTAPENPSPQLVTAMSQIATTDTDIAASIPDTTYDALVAVENAQGPGADFHAIPITEQQLVSTNSSASSMYRPSGRTPVADHPAALLRGEWSDETRTAAAALFVDFARQPASTPTIEGVGFATDADGPGAANVVPVSSGSVMTGLLDIVRNPILPRRATILLDISGSMDTTEGGGTRLQNTVRALNFEFGRAPDASELGLWSFSKDLDGSRPYRIEVPTGPMTADVAGVIRRNALESRSTEIAPASATSTYASLAAVYRSAVDGFTAGRPNSIVLITDGPNDDASVTSDRLVADIKGLFEPARPVAVHVVTLGTNTDVTTFEAVAASTGGTVVSVASSADPALTDELGKLLY